MKYCDEYAALLDLYVDGELSPEEMARVQAHLDACPGCRAYVDDALAIRAAFPDVEETEVPAGFAGGVMAAIRTEAPAEAKRKPSRARFWKTAAPLAACLAVIVLLQTGTWGGGEKHATATDAVAPRTAMAAGAVTETAESAAASEEAAEAPAETSLSDQKPLNTAKAGTPAPAAAMAPQTFSMESLTDTGAASPRLTLTAEEAGDLLADLTPVEETETELRYELTAEQLDTLLAALSDAGIVPAGDAPAAEAESGTALVIVTK